MLEVGSLNRRTTRKVVLLWYSKSQKFCDPIKTWHGGFSLLFQLVYLSFRNTHSPVPLSSLSFGSVTCMLTCLHKVTDSMVNSTAKHSDCAAMVPVWHSHSLCFVTRSWRVFFFIWNSHIIKMSVHFFLFLFLMKQDDAVWIAHAFIPHQQPTKTQQPNNRRILLHNTRISHTDAEQQDVVDVVVALAMRRRKFKNLIGNLFFGWISFRLIPFTCSLISLLFPFTFGVKQPSNHLT